MAAGRSLACAAMRRLPDLRRYLVALAALLSGGLVAGGLLLVDRSAAGAQEYVVAARDLPAGAPLTADALATVRLQPAAAARLAIPAAQLSALSRSRTAHELAAGQLIQRGDVSGPAEAADRRLVWLPLKDLPPLAPGDRLDLLELSGPPEHLTVLPFALDLSVRSASAAGVVVAVPSRQAPALLYALAAGRLVGIAAPAGSGPGQEGPVGSAEQAQSLLRH